MPPVYEGARRGEGRRFGIVVSRTNDFITRKLLAGAEETLRQGGVGGDDVDVVWVPGSFELGQAAVRLAARRRVDAVICLGAVIRGETWHHEVIGHAGARGIEAAARETGRPVTFGVITADSSEQALERAGGSRGNLGARAAQAALEMADVYGKLDAPRRPRRRAKRGRRKGGD
ncbi:MAG: 6,7-dimethyl-8-ribityllumazine synthase [Planctomycetales bacterium]|nr:6,7-dimethyl-8-ribityllumazine synthase [Planctomycetales bacterium]